jgi:hypothetical protein
MNENKKKTENSYTENTDNARFCGLPIVPDRELEYTVNPTVESLIRYIEKKWVNHTLLHYHFLNSPQAWRGEEAQKEVVRASFKEWKDLGIGLEFKEVPNPADAEIRIGFEPGGSWSYVGRDAIDLVPDQNERTMNFGWDLTTPYGHDTALHEIGHALGFPHEHQNPNAGIIWNEDNVYSYFGGSPNYWDRDTTYYNVIRKISAAEVQGSQWDKDSIMHYQFQAGLINIPIQYQTQPLIPEPGLSAFDIEEVRKFYPGEDEVQYEELKPYLSKMVQINPGDQLNFIIKPQISRRYMIQTFGNFDTVIVLFEDIDGEPVFLAGDDDSGTNFNAQIETRLLRNHTYYLRLRLYYAESIGQGAVMLW